MFSGCPSSIWWHRGFHPLPVRFQAAVCGIFWSLLEIHPGPNISDVHEKSGVIGDLLKWTMENRDNDMRKFMKLMAQQLDFTMISPWFTWQEILGPRPRKQPLLLGCHGGLSVSWAHDSEDHKAKTQDPSHFTNLLQTIHRDLSISIMWVPDFSDHIKDHNQEERDVLSAQPMKAAIATWSRYGMSQVTQKDAWLIPCMSKTPCVWGCP